MAINNRFADASRFWVMFDTCQLPEYYLDVHKLLALPAGAIIRYDYRSDYISTEALAVLDATSAAPRDVLVIYVQHVRYKRGDGPGYQPTANEDVFAMGTRFARMRLAPNIGGQRYAFDLEVEGYPKLDPQVLNRILEALIEKNEAPWSKWVSISGMTDELAKLRSGRDADNWVAIASQLQSHPSQFEGDVFWRLGSPVLDGESPATLIYETQSATAPGGIRQIQFAYPLIEGQGCEFEVFSIAAHKLVRQLQLSVSAGGPLEVVGPNIIRLRYDASTRFKIKGQRMETVFDRSGTLSLNSGAPVNDWPIGPQLDLQFTVRKSKIAVALGASLLLIAVVCGFVATTVWKDSLTWGIVCTIGSAAFVLVGGAILYGRIGVRA
jgi:hypothetical protein